MMKTTKERCFSAHSERLRPLTKRPQQPDLLTRMQRLNAGRHDDVAIGEPLRNRPTVPGSKRSTSTLRSDTVEARGIDDPDGRLAIVLVRALAGIDVPGVASCCMRPVTVAPSRMAAGGSMRLTRTLNVRVTGSACGSTWRTRPCAVTEGSSVSVDDDLGIRRRRADHLGRNVEHGVPSVHRGRPGRPSARPARLRPIPRRPRGDRAGDIGPELRVAHPVLGDMQLRLGVIHLRLRRAQVLLGLIEQNPCRKSSVHQLALAVEIIARLNQFPLAAESAACADRSAFNSFCGSSLASTWSGST